MTIAPPSGMDHKLYDYAAMPSRPRLVWPHGARLAVMVLLYFETWDLIPSAHDTRDPRFKDMNGTFTPDHFLFSLKEYGNRVGIFRLLDLLDQSRLKVTVAANAEACVRYPDLVQRFRQRDYEIAAHGLNAAHMITSRISLDEERSVITQCLDRIEQTTGRRPQGWVGQDFGESIHTPNLASEAGLSYIVDWPNDDQPYMMTTPRSLVSIPNQAEWDDVEFLWHRRISGARYAAAVQVAADRLHAEGATNGRLLVLGVHPWILGTPHRFRYFEQAVRHIESLPATWFASAGDLTRHMLANGPSEARPA